jgi:aryl-alcohol dehydrogenase-like predicted oxidoreductase
MKWISKIGLGSVQFGLPYGISNTTGQTPTEEVAEILDYAFDSGIRLIDTASGYGDAESVLGATHQNRFVFVSKFMPPAKGETIEKQLNQSLELLKIAQLYGYLAHRPLALLENPEQWEELQYLKKQRKITKIGFSLNTPEEYIELKAMGFIPDLVQVPFNYFDNRFASVLKELHANGCEVHTRSTFLQGLFFMDANKLSDFFSPFYPELEYLQTTFKNNLSASLLKYVIEQPFVDKVILGIENANQLEENINGLETAMDLKPLSKQFSDQLVMPMHWPKE